MRDHEYVLIQRNGEAIHAVDGFPNEMLRLNCKTFILRLPGLEGGEIVGLAPDMEFSIPEGFGLIFKRRTTVGLACNGSGEQERGWKYIIGIEPLKQERCGATDDTRT